MLKDADPTALARRARALVGSCTRGALATVSVAHGGWPFGSVVDYSLDDAGRPVIAISSLAEHRLNLEADPRASLLVVDPTPGPAPARVTILARFSAVPEAARSAVAEAHVRVVPDVGRVLGLRDFGLFRGEVARVRFIAGFGVAAWIAPADWAGAASR